MAWRGQIHLEAMLQNGRVRQALTANNNDYCQTLR
jgi:hypothetical protein